MSNALNRTHCLLCDAIPLAGQLCELCFAREAAAHPRGSPLKAPAESLGYRARRRDRDFPISRPTEYGMDPQAVQALVERIQRASPLDPLPEGAAPRVRVF